jgi:hypothetical protein
MELERSFDGTSGLWKPEGNEGFRVPFEDTRLCHTWVGFYDVLQ